MNNRSTKPAISVIVPVYKVEPYIHQCVDSILGQTFPDFELILVDDGSPDNCGAICDEYAQKDNRVDVIHQKNQGVSAARNAGLDITRGEYIAFIDSDDVVAPDYLKRLHSIANAEDADLVVSKLYEFRDGEPIPEVCDSCGSTPVTMTGPQALAYRYTGAFYIGPGGKLIAKRRLKSHRFPIGMKWEDQAVIPYVIYESEQVSITEEKLYYYRIHSESASHSGFSATMFDNILHMNAFIPYLKGKKEYTLAASAKKHRDNSLALYTVQARRHGLTDIPQDCEMSEFRALSIVRKNVSNDLFIWFLDSLHPNWVRPYAYFRKIESILTGKPLMGENCEKN